LDTATGLSITIPREFIEDGGAYALTAITETGRTI